jgi:AraC-like DNA-binding protein
MSELARARLFLPPPALGACVFLGVERDTRGLQLTEPQRFNYYPASPFPMISWIFEGALHMVAQAGEALVPALGPALPRVVFSGPHRTPSASWSPGPVHALSVSFYPEAMAKLIGVRIERYLDAIVPLEEVVGGPLREPLQAIAVDDGRPAFDRLATALRPHWQSLFAQAAVPTIRGWVTSMAVRAAFSRTGAGMRQAQRRIKAWTGQSHRDLRLYVRTERAMAQAAARPAGSPPDLAALAADAGFADQSHLGREVRRVTGLSPARFDELIRTDESFWIYRLLMGHLHSRRP